MICLENVSFKYNKQTTNCLRDVSFNLEAGKILGVVGASGSGKSTLLRIIAGLEEGATGQIVIDDRIVQDNHTFVQPRKRGVGMLFQDYALFPHMTIKENIAFGISGAHKNERVKEMFELVRLLGYEDKYPHELSGGERQRVALGRALGPKPKVLLLDEPFSNLDKALQDNIRDELLQILRAANITAILVTHNQEDVDKMANYVLKLCKNNMDTVVCNN